MIGNFKDLAITSLRQAALEIAEAGLMAIATPAAIRRLVFLKDDILRIDGQNYDLTKIGKILFVGIGKCALEAGLELEEVLNGRLDEGIIVDVHQPKFKIQNSKFEIFVGTHPFPSEQNIDITKKIIGLLSGLTEKDLVIFAISGGGSTLLCQPQDMTCYNEADLLKVLFEKGATIQEINTVRKHLSLARGGYLAKYLYPAKGAVLIFADVPGDNFEFVASGPTVKDTTTVTEAAVIVQKYDVEKICGFSCNLIETPKDDIYFENICNILAVSNKTALVAMAAKADDLGFKVEIKTAVLSGEAKDVGREIAEDLNTIDGKAVLLYGGETTVTVKKPGRGGRNQELALAALPILKAGELVLVLASDGRDNGEYAGAIVDLETNKKAEALNLSSAEFLENNQSTDFFEKTGDFLMTGDTGSNVSDLVIAIKN
ncbi:MAG: DUF4147 domain-containing protein [bacterium]|nr:DUF4147 domain-containing protein [bacterium]